MSVANPEQAAERMVEAIGSTIRKLRIERQWTLGHVSELTGLSPSLLSLVERGKTSPSIGTLVTVADALGVPIGDLVPSSQRRNEYPVVHLDSQRARWQKTGTALWELLEDPDLKVKVTYNEYNPGGESSKELLYHDGTEFGFVVEGSLTLLLGGDRFVARRGDLLHYDSSIPHRHVNEGSEHAAAIWFRVAQRRRLRREE